jgi:aspartate racemase
MQNYSNKIIAIIGGMGPESSLLFHRLLLEKDSQYHQITQDQDHVNIIHYALSNQIPDRSSYLLGVELKNPAEPIIKIIELLHNHATQNDWEILAVAICNTFHASAIYGEISAYIDRYNLSHIKFLHLINETVEEIILSEKMGSKIGIMSTTGEWKARLYQTALENHGFIGVQVSSSLQEMLHDIIYCPLKGIKSSLTLSEDFYSKFNEIIVELKGKGVKKIILGCTELSLIKHMIQQEGLIFIDPLEIIAKRMILWAGK